MVIRLSESLNTGDTHLNLFRHILAFSVFYSHLHYQFNIPEPSNGYHSIGWYAVNGFFLLSGLLVSHSFQKNSFKQYLINRGLRILPAFYTGVLLSISAPIILNIIQSKIYDQHQIFNLIYILIKNLIPIKEVIRNG